MNNNYKILIEIKADDLEKLFGVSDNNIQLCEEFFQDYVNEYIYEYSKLKFNNSKTSNELSDK